MMRVKRAGYRRVKKGFCSHLLWTTRQSYGLSCTLIMNDDSLQLLYHIKPFLNVFHLNCPPLFGITGFGNHMPGALEGLSLLFPLGKLLSD